MTENGYALSANDETTTNETSNNGNATVTSPDPALCARVEHNMQFILDHKAEMTIRAKLMEIADLCLAHPGLPDHSFVLIAEDPVEHRYMPLAFLVERIRCSHALEALKTLYQRHPHLGSSKRSPWHASAPPRRRSLSRLSRFH